MVIDPVGEAHLGKELFVSVALFVDELRHGARFHVGAHHAHVDGGTSRGVVVNLHVSEVEAQT